MNPKDCVWKEVSQEFMKTMLQGKVTIHTLHLYNLVHIFIHMPQAKKILAAKEAADRESEKLDKISSWSLAKVRNKSEVIEEAKLKDVKVHFASLMDICHLKNSELEKKHQKYMGRVELRGDIV